MRRGRHITRVKLNLICDIDEYESLEETYKREFQWRLLMTDAASYNNSIEINDVKQKISWDVYAL